MFIYLSVLRHLILFFELRNIPIRNKFLETTLLSIHVWSRTEFVPATSYPPPTLSVRAFLDFPPLSKSWSTWSNLEANFPDCEVHCVYCYRPLNTNDWNFLPSSAYISTVTMHCRLMSPGSLALITQKPCQHQPHH